MKYHKKDSYIFTYVKINLTPRKLRVKFSSGYIRVNETEKMNDINPMLYAILFAK